MRRATARERLRYRFDNFMSRGTIALILGLFASSLLVIALAAVFVAMSGAASAEKPRPGLPSLIWRSLMRTLDAGTMGGDSGTAAYLATMLFVTFAGIFVVSILIGVLSAGIEGRLAEMRKGRSRALESNHTVILGWSQQIFPILAELVEANANQRRAAVVVLADRDKVEMEDAIRSYVRETRTTRIICRSGSPIDMGDIDLAGVQASKAIIVLSPDSDEPDADVIKTLLAVTNDPDRRAEPYHVVAEIRDPRNLEVARMVGGGEVELTLAGELVARIIAQTCRQSGLSVVYGDLLDFAGDEIYFTSQPALTGRTFGDALLLFEDTALVGIDDGTPRLNPPMDTVIGAGHRLLVVSADDDKIRPVATAASVDAARIRSAAVAGPAAPERTLVLGWNWRASSIVAELDGYVGPGSEVLVVSNVAGAAEDAAGTSARLRNQRLEFREADVSDRRVLDELEVGRFEHVIVLSPAGLDGQRADARTLVTLLHLRDIAQRAGSRVSIVSEMIDMRNRALAEVAKPDDFIVSDRLVSLVTVQIAENKALAAVFQDLFDAGGSEVYLKPAGDYVETGSPVSFATVVEAARQRSEVAFGYRLRALAENPARAYGVVINPRKSETVTLTAADRVIVLAES